MASTICGTHRAKGTSTHVNASAGFEGAPLAADVAATSQIDVAEKSQLTRLFLQHAASLVIAIKETLTDCTDYTLVKRFLHNDDVVSFTSRFQSFVYTDAVVVTAALQSNSNLLQLHVRGFQNLGNSGAGVIAESPKLNSCLQCCSHFGEAGAAAIAQSLKVNTCLQELVLGDNPIGDAGAAAIAESLQRNASLQKPELFSAQIGDAGATAIAEALKLNSSLQRLNLSHNRIGDAGASAIAESLKLNSSLQELILTGYYITDAGATAIAQSI
jgi:hypothetical protein